MTVPAHILAAINAAATVGPDMTEAVAGGGGDFTPPEAGYVRLRLITYIELGIHEEEYEGKPRKREKVYMAFELSGPKHPVKEDGQPHVIGFQETLSLNEKANFFKLFTRLNYDKSARHMCQLLGKPFIGTVVHNVKGEGDKKKTYANLRDKEGYTIRPAFRVDDESGESIPVKVDEPRTPLKVFLWNLATKEMWDDIFIDGEWEAKTNDKGEVTRKATSKNYFQNLIRKATNWRESPMAEILGAGGDPLADLPEAEKVERSEANIQASNDAKAGVDEDPLANVA